jgi:hypothetical protein
MTPTSQHLGESDLQQIEHALLEALLDVSGNRSNAVDQLLHHFKGSRPELEQLLVAAVSDTHSGRNRALDRILDQIPTTPAA